MLEKRCIWFVSRRSFSRYSGALSAPGHCYSESLSRGGPVNAENDREFLETLYRLQSTTWRLNLIKWSSPSAIATYFILADFLQFHHIWEAIQFVPNFIQIYLYITFVYWNESISLNEFPRFMTPWNHKKGFFNFVCSSVAH